jgi:hypothetical protein
VTDFDVAFKAVAPHIKSGMTVSDQQMIGLKLIGSMAKSDCLSLAMERLVDVVETSRSDKDKIAASAIINELYGEKELIADVKLTDRLMINLVGDG